MKKLTITCLILFFSIHAFTKDVSKKIDIYAEGEYIQSYTIEQFATMINNNEILLDITQAELNSKVIISLSTEDYTFINNVYEGYITISWYNPQGAIVKQLIAKTTLTLEKTELSLYEKLDQTYTTVSKCLVPILTICLLLCL